MGEHELPPSPLEPEPAPVMQPPWYAAAVKALLAFLGLLVTNILADLQSGRPWPETGWEWLRWLLTIVGGTYAVYRIPNAKPAPPAAAPGAG